MSPGCCLREEGQHRRKVQVSITHSSGNNKCLRKLIVDWVGWFGLTSMEGRAAQAWPCLLSCSPGSSSTKPATLYLQVFSIFDFTNKTLSSLFSPPFWSMREKFCSYRVTWLLFRPPIKTMLSLSGIPHDRILLRLSVNVGEPPGRGKECFELFPL